MTDAAPKGYLSEERRRSYTILVGILGVGGFLAQFVLPYALMLALLPSMLPFGDEGMRLPEFRSGAVWQGAAWFPEQRLAPPTGQASPQRLCRAALAREAALDCPVELEHPGTVLLPDGDRMWLLSEAAVATFDGKNLQPVEVTGRPGSPRSPFLLGGKPGIVVFRPGAWSVLTLEEGTWRERWSVPARGDDEGEEQLRVVAVGDRAHLFLSAAGTVFHREAGPDGEVPADDAWISVAHVEGAWSAVAAGGHPVVVVFPPGSGVGSILAYRPSDDGVWTSFFRTPSPTFTVSGAALASPGSRGFVLAWSKPFGGGRLKEVRDDASSENYTFGRSPFPKFFKGIFAGMFGAMFAVCLGVAVVLSIVMPRYRTVRHDGPTGSVDYAPVWRRAVAQVVDALILCGPIVAGYASMFSMFDDPEAFGAGRVFASMGLILGGFAWALAGMVAISFVEGRWGLTPGKALVGIRTLGTDLQPCGFGRALLRNVLTVVDGFFNFLVGLMLVALTEQWQRVGDLVARTVVVMAPKRGGEGA